MIEVLFGESEAGSMKAAKCTVITRKVDGPTSVWTVGKKKLPEYKLRSDNSMISYSNWGEVAAEEFAGFLTCEKKLSMEEIQMYAMLWNNLQEDNSPLRAVVNGKLIGVPEDFYDFLIWKRITRKPIKEARLIGDILGYHQLGVGDWWYAKRIDYFIQTGKIKIVEDSENKYARTICLA